jgi:hypothetical protein
VIIPGLLKKRGCDISRRKNSEFFIFPKIPIRFQRVKYAIKLKKF